VEKLEEGLGRGLVLVCAPPGFGKTALLAHWIRAGQRPVAWLSLDAGDNDPARFWRHAVAALDRISPGIADEVTPLIEPSGPPSFDGVVTAMINQLASQAGEGEVLLLLDDYHLIESQPVHTSLMFPARGCEALRGMVGECARRAVVAHPAAEQPRFQRPW
jgi:LuxR family maltose regulon positive regulatory protein